MSNVFGEVLKISIFGESHSEAIGVVIDGLPAGLAVDWEAVGTEMARRAPGQNALSTQRAEQDLPHIKSGFFEGRTTGTPLCALIENTNTRSGDYERDVLRPSHADYTGKIRYGGFNDYRGGGHFSGRLTAPLVFAGALCKQFLNREGMAVLAHLASVGKVLDKRFEPCSIDSSAADAIRARELPVLDETVIGPMKETILSAKAAGDSVGGVIECAATGVPAGLGSPFFGSVESRLSAMLYSVPAVKAVAFGDGFALSEMAGSEANDCFAMEDGRIVTRTNHNGGISGGITNGMPLLFSVAVRPTPSIAKEQDTVDYKKKENTKTRIRGRHDPCIAHRAVPVIEAACAIVLADLVLEARTYAGK